MRVDKWLWFARFYKSRSLAAHTIEGGEVLVNGRIVDKPSRLVQPGDALELPIGRFRRRIRILALGTRRGPASEARALYEVIGADVLPDPFAGAPDATV